MTEQEGSSAAAGGWRAASRRTIAALAALAVVALLVALVMLTDRSNRARDAALARERHSYDVTVLTGALGASLARSEAALGFFVANGDRMTGTRYYDEWRRAGRQVDLLGRLVAGDPRQSAAVAELRDLYLRRGQELEPPALRATYRQGLPALSLLARAGRSDTLPRIARVLNAIADHEAGVLRSRSTSALSSAEWSNRLAGTVSVAGILLLLVAIGLAVLSAQALAARRAARDRAEAEADRAGALATAVAARTRELSDANEALQQEAEERRLAEDQRAVAEQQLRQMQKMEAVGQLTGGIAHDFNNMLSVVVNGLDLARRRLEQQREEATRHIDQAMEGANRAAALTRRLLTFARSEPLMPRAIDPGVLVAGMQELMTRTLGERIEVALERATATWPVWVDGYQLENAILNLAVNARDAMDGAGRITIAIGNAPAGVPVRDLDPGDYVTIAVRDTGSGMTPDVIDRVFEPFFTTKPVGQGTGLGLSQIFGFARQSGGTVAIDSTPGEGTAVTLYLPRAAGQAVTVREVSAAPIADAAAPSDPQAAQGRSILVVEDDPRVRTSTAAALAELGYRPLAVASAEDALVALEGAEPVDLILTDVMMPTTTGPELLRMVEERHGALPALFVTGFVGDTGDTDQFAGHDVLRKPFTVNGLAAAVEAALARSAADPQHKAA